MYILYNEECALPAHSGENVDEVLYCKIKEKEYEK